MDHELKTCLWSKEIFDYLIGWATQFLLEAAMILENWKTEARSCWAWLARLLVCYRQVFSWNLFQAQPCTIIPSCNSKSVGWEGPMVIMSGQHYISRALSLVQSSIQHFEGLETFAVKWCKMHPQQHASIRWLFFLASTTWMEMAALICRKWWLQYEPELICWLLSNWYSYVRMCTDDSPCELVLDAYFINWCMGESKVTNFENIHRSQYLFSIRMIPIRWEASSKASRTSFPKRVFRMADAWSR